MRRDGQNSRVFFRANSDFVALARARADQEGKSLSELIRQAISREVSLASPADHGTQSLLTLPPPNLAPVTPTTIY